MVGNKEIVILSDSFPIGSVNKEAFTELFASGLTYDELGSVFNIHKQTVFRLIVKLGLKRKRVTRQRIGGRNGRVSQMKSPSLKSCRNPDCDYYFYGFN